MSVPTNSTRTASSTIRYSEYYSTLTSEAKLRYASKMNMISTTIDPYIISEKNSGASSSCSLISSVEWYEWPDVSFADIYNYLILTPSFCTHDQLKAYKSMDGYNFFMNGWVGNIIVSAIKTRPKKFLLMGSVKHSQQLSASPFKDKSINEMVDQHDFCLASVDGSVSLKKDHAYYYQIQLQMKICEVEYCNFVVWSEECIFYERISIDTEFIDNAIKEAEPFIKLALLPELVGKWFSRQTVATSIDSTQINQTLSTSDNNAPTTSTSSDNMQTTSESDDGAKVWCFCKQDEPYGDMMIGCDNPACPIQWFHLSCLKLEQHQVPKGKWYCPLCHRDK